MKLQRTKWKSWVKIPGCVMSENAIYREVVEWESGRTASWMCNLTDQQQLSTKTKISEKYFQHLVETLPQRIKAVRITKKKKKGVQYGSRKLN